MATFIINDIKYDLSDSQGDASLVDLPATLKTTLADSLSAEEIEESLSDFITAETGFCHTGFTFSQDEQEPFTVIGIYTDNMQTGCFHIHASSRVAALAWKNEDCDDWIPIVALKGHQRDGEHLSLSCQVFF